MQLAAPGQFVDTVVVAGLVAAGAAAAGSTAAVVAPAVLVVLALVSAALSKPFAGLPTPFVVAVATPGFVVVVPAVQAVVVAEVVAGLAVGPDRLRLPQLQVVVPGVPIGLALLFARPSNGKGGNGERESVLLLL